MYWVEETTAALFGAKKKTKKMKAATGGATATEDSAAAAVAIDALVGELAVRSRFERGLDAVMHARAKKLEKEACPDPHT